MIFIQKFYQSQKIFFTCWEFINFLCLSIFYYISDVTFRNLEISSGKVKNVIQIPQFVPISEIRIC